jgi:hypothetical protein
MFAKASYSNKTYIRTRETEPTHGSTPPYPMLQPTTSIPSAHNFRPLNYFRPCQDLRQLNERSGSSSPPTRSLRRVYDPPLPAPQVLCSGLFQTRRKYQILSLMAFLDFFATYYPPEDQFTNNISDWEHRKCSRIRDFPLSGLFSTPFTRASHPS